MILPRSHTWMHLLPVDAAFCCDGCPDWLAEPALARGGKGKRVLVSWRARDLPATDGYEGVIAVQPRKDFSRNLRAAGFSHVRRFAVLPDLREPRWFIPIDSPNVSAAAFWLYTPFRLSAKLKLLAATAAIHARLPIWYRDEICIAQRVRPPIERVLQDVFPNREIILALSSGALGPDARRKPSVAVLGADGSRLGFVKIAGSPVAAQLIAHEEKVLSALHQYRGLATNAPKLLFAGDIEGTEILVQSALSGRRVGPAITPAHHQFLERMRIGPAKAAVSTQLVRSLCEQAAIVQYDSLDLLRMLEEIAPKLSKMNFPETITHTDFVPWNLRRENFAISAFDWDTAELDGLPLFDLLHHRVMVGYCLDNWSAERARDELLALTAHTPGMHIGEARVIAIVYLIHSILRMLAQGHAQEHPMVEWYAQVLKWLAARQKEFNRATSNSATAAGR